MDRPTNPRPNREHHRAVQKAYRAKVEGQHCACGNPAAKTVGGEFVCQRCLDIQNQMWRHEKFAGYTKGKRECLLSKYVDPFLVANVDRWKI
jgi:hypothetical protein